MSNRLDMIDEEPWYADGLRFKCTECGKCCTGAPGYVWVTEQEIISIAAYLNLSIDAFTEKYVRIAEGRLALLEDPVNYDCIFLRDKKCQIYPVRPKQCRTFPWWPNTLKSEKDWQKAAKYCEGINLQAPLVSYQTITEQLAIQTKRHDSTAD